MKDIHDVIKHAKFGDDRLRGSGVVAGQISAFLIDFAGRPYNTLTLPCGRVMDRSAPSYWTVRRNIRSEYMLLLSVILIELAEIVDFDSEVSGRPNDSNNYAVTRPTTVLTSLSCL